MSILPVLPPLKIKQCASPCVVSTAPGLGITGMSTCSTTENWELEGTGREGKKNTRKGIEPHGYRTWMKD